MIMWRMLCRWRSFVNARWASRLAALSAVTMIAFGCQSNVTSATIWQVTGYDALVQEHPLSYWYPAWSPNGRYIVYSRESSHGSFSEYTEPDTSEIFVLDTASR